MARSIGWHNLLRFSVVNTTIQNLTRNAMVEPVYALQKSSNWLNLANSLAVNTNW